MADVDGTSAAEEKGGDSGTLANVTTLDQRRFRDNGVFLASLLTAAQRVLRKPSLDQMENENALRKG